MARLRVPGKAGTLVRPGAPAQASGSAYVKPVHANASPSDSKKRKLENEAVTPSKKMPKSAETTPSKAVKPATPNGTDAGKPAVKSRNSNPGIRVQGGRIYDSENGRTCHQCRQKTLETMALCDSRNAKDSPKKKGKTSTPKKNVRPCSRYWCPKCLENRYGEKHNEVPKGWSCPFCRGVCNCSVCRRKQGDVATGILTHTAKAAGFGSVAALLQKHPDVKPVTNAVVASLMTPCASPAKSLKDAPLRTANGTPKKAPGTPTKGTPLATKRASPAKATPPAAPASPSPAPSRRASLPRVASSRSMSSGTPARSRSARSGLATSDGEQDNDDVMSCDEGLVGGNEGEEEEEEEAGAASSGKCCLEDSQLPPAEAPWEPPVRPLSLPSCCVGLDVGQLLEVTHFLLQFAQPLGLKSFSAESFLEEMSAVPFASGKSSRRGGTLAVAQVHAALLQAVRGEMGLRGTVGATTEGALSWVPMLCWYLSLYVPLEETDAAAVTATNGARRVLPHAGDSSGEVRSASLYLRSAAHGGTDAGRSTPVANDSDDSDGGREAAVSAGNVGADFAAPSGSKREGRSRSRSSNSSLKTAEGAQDAGTTGGRGGGEGGPSQVAMEVTEDRMRFHAVPDSELRAMLVALRGSGHGSKGYPGLTPGQRLVLLKMLCDDVLATGVLRGHIESAMERTAEQEKAVKEKRAEARRQMKKDAAERRAALIAQLVRGRDELSLDEQRVLVEESQVKVAALSTATLQALDDSINNGRRCVRFAPLGEDRHGRRFWPLVGQIEVPWGVPGGLVLMQWLHGDDLKPNHGTCNGTAASRSQRGKAASTPPPQEQWTCLLREDVEALVPSLDERGR
eukprot:jgi/Mesvir1/26996/Mv20707-RA.1